MNLAAGKEQLARGLGVLTGLRPRLLIAFALLCVFTAVIVAGGIYVLARRVILQQAQDAAVSTLTQNIEHMPPLGQLPVGPATVAHVADALSTRAYRVRVTAGTAVAGDLPASAISAELHGVVDRGQVGWQRVDVDGAAVLVIGTQLRIGDPNDPNRSTPSGVDVYAATSLFTEQLNIAQLADITWATGAVCLGVALLLALIAARGVLRPVRQLRTAAEGLGRGDLTTRLPVRGHDELAEVARTFNGTAQALEDLVAELRRMEADARRFVADVSHELRTPLTAMAAVVDVLDDQAGELPELAGEAVRLVRDGTQNLTRLVNDLIEVTRFDSGTAALALDEVEIAAAVRATLRARGWTERVETELPEGIRAQVDPRRLDVIIANLVGNALRHGAPPVTIGLSEEGAQVVITVADRGPGLAEEVLPQVFQRFYKADSARSREGSGLGLAIAWENARLHTDGERSGSLVAGNRPEGGAVFTLRLPRGPIGGAS